MNRADKHGSCRSYQTFALEEHRTLAWDLSKRHLWLVNVMLYYIPPSVANSFTRTEIHDAMLSLRQTPTVAQLLTLFCATACSEDRSPHLYGSEPSTIKQFTLLSASETRIDFKNDLIEDIGRHMDVLSYQYYFNGGGVAIIDINNDGLSDVFLTANTGSNRLYLNKGGMHFEDITKKAGVQDRYWSTGATVVDINNDGWDDLYVCNGGVYTEPSERENKLYLNNGDNTFNEKAAAYGINDGNRSTQAAFFDHDGDGDLDL